MPAPAAASASASPAVTANCIVIGVGTELRGDDGFGAAVIEALRGRPALAGRAILARCDGEPSRMIDLWDGYDRAIVVDSARGGAERHGHLYRRDLAARTEPADPLREYREPRGNSHAAGLGAAIRLAHALDRLPPHLVLYAVHGRDFTLGAPLTPPVAAAVPELAARISREILAEALVTPRQTEGPGPHPTSGPGTSQQRHGNLTVCP